jgi:hypothetical protein
MRATITGIELVEDFETLDHFRGLAAIAMIDQAHHIHTGTSSTRCTVTQTTFLLHGNMQQHMRVPLLREPHGSQSPQNRDHETL